LAEQQDVRGVDEILKGLKTLEEDPQLDMWRYRANIYLSAAAKFHDERLVEPLIRILAVSKNPQVTVHETVIKLLAAYDDPRLVNLFTQRLIVSPDKRSHFNRGAFHETALTAITRRLAAKTPAYLIEQFRDSDNANFRAAILLGLAELSCAHYRPYPGKTKWSRDVFETPEEQIKLATATRKLAIPILLAQLENADAHINYMAAVGLTIIAQDKSSTDRKRLVEPLTNWCRKRQICFYPLTEYLGQHGDAETGRALLEVLKSQAPNRGESHLIGAIQKLKPAGALPVLQRNVRAYVDRYKGRYGPPVELGAMSEFGDPGTQAVFAILTDIDQLNIQLSAAGILARKKHKPAAEPIAALLQRTIDSGPTNQKLNRRSSESKEQAFVRTCASLLKSLATLDNQQAKKIAEDVIRNGPKSIRAECLKVWAAK
jgi:hypothetical protein